MKLSLVISALALVSPVVALKGARNTKEYHRVLKGDDGGNDDEDGGILGDLVPDLGDVDLEELTELLCFSEVATVQVQDKGSVSMKDLQIGDAVLTSTGNFEPVYAFGHHNPTQKAPFVQLSTSDNTALEMTGEHLVFLQDKLNPVRADSVQVGDKLRGNNAPTVTKIDTVQRQGLYAPFTATGTLIVDGVMVSSYVSTQKGATEFVQIGSISTGISQHDYVHWGMSPLRMLCQGVSTTFCTASNNEQGMPSWVRFAIALNKFADNSHPFVQAAILLAVFLVVAACMMLENTLGASTAPTTLAFVGATYGFMKATGLSVRAQKAKTV